MWVLHTCDNPLCCNPLHLFLGDNLANNRDKTAKGRQVHGETHKLAKLTEPDVIVIKRALADGSLSRKDLAARFGVSLALIDHIAAGKTWKHVKIA
jgi:ribosome-binding protein aMBF1 (putative translation factor)